jgi:hypothetical protein
VWRGSSGPFILLAACAGTGKHGGSADADSDTDTDTDTESGTGTGTGTDTGTESGTDSETDSGSDTGTGLDPFVEGTWRMTNLTFTLPEVLTDDVVQNLVQENIDEQVLNWIVDLRDRDGDTCAFTTGAATTADGGATYAWDLVSLPVEGTADCTDAGFGIPAGDGTIDLVEIPVEGKAISFLFRIHEATMDGVLGVLPAVTGTTAGKITAIDADTIPLGDLGATLCGLLADDVGALDDYDDDCDNLFACLAGDPPPDAAWDCDADGTPPDSDVAGEPAWTLEADFRANEAELAGVTLRGSKYLISRDSPGLTSREFSGAEERAPDPSAV